MENSKKGRKEIYAGGSVSKGFRLPKNKFDEAVKAVESALMPFRSDYISGGSKIVISTFEELGNSINPKTTSVKISPELSNHMESMRKVDEASDREYRELENGKIESFPVYSKLKCIVTNLERLQIYRCGCVQESKLFRREKNCKLPKDKHNGKD